MSPARRSSSPAWGEAALAGRGRAARFSARQRDLGLDLLISAGVHGNELIPIHVLDRLIRALARGEIRPRARLLLLFANPAAMRRTLRQVDHDLNRLFRARMPMSGAARPFVRRSWKHWSAASSVVPRQRRHYDLHSAMRPSRLPQFAICPWREDQQAPAEALARLQGLAIDGVLLQRQATPTFTALTAMRHGAEAFTLELAESG